MALIISGLILLVVTAIISINHKNRRIKELEAACTQLNDDLQTVSVLACTTEDANTSLKGEIDFRDRKIEALTGEDLEEDSQFSDEHLEEAKANHRPIVAFNTLSKKPLTKQEAFERYYAARQAGKIYNTVEEGKK